MKHVFQESFYGKMKSKTVTSFLPGAPVSMASLGHCVKWRLMNAYQDRAKTVGLVWTS